MKAVRDNSPLAIPPDLLAGIRETADEEHQLPDDVLRQIIEHGLEERRWQRVLAYGADRAKRLGLTEADVPRLIAEARLPDDCARV